MKINLLLDNPKDILSGYCNIDPFAEKDAVVCDINNLSPICDDNEASHILVRHILCYFPAKNIDEILNHWFKKLAYNGILTIVDTDINQVTKAISNKSIGIEESNLLLYGNQQKQWDYKKCALSLLAVTEVLKNKGLNIIKKKLDGVNFIVEAQRPGVS